MAVKIPQEHNFNQNRILKKDVFDKTGGSVPDWEISVQRTDDVAWSVVLSYLISPNYRSKIISDFTLTLKAFTGSNKNLKKLKHENNLKIKKDFARRLKALTGSDENLKLVEKAIRWFNPFRNRHSCFYNEALKQVVAQFKSNLNWDSLRKISDKLKSVSDILGCPVLLIWRNNNIIEHRIYSGGIEKNSNIIALYSSNFKNEKSGSTGTVYNFLITHELGLKLKHASLMYFLREAKISKNSLKKVESVVEKGEHFLISLLDSNCQDVVTELYKSAYLVSKLTEAGYETDPRTTDSNGFSALHHALLLGEVNTINILYEFSANNCCQSESSYRNPDPYIVDNLHQLEEILSEDLSKFSSFKRPPNYRLIKKRFDDLLRLNKFLIEVNSKIVRIINEINCESTDEMVFEACKTRDFLLSVFHTYEKYFAYDSNTTVSPVDDYIKYRNYYKSIDIATGIIFFDNIIFFKNRLHFTNQEQFSRIEMSFFLTVLSHIVLEKQNFLTFISEVNTIRFFSQINIKRLSFISLTRRRDNMEKIKEFSKKLLDIKINNENVNCITKREIHSSLNSFPIFQSEVNFHRLNRYIKTAEYLKVTDAKSVLVIERVLQVIGEYITADNRDHTFRRFLSLILPKEISHVLHRIRNELSHLHSYAFKSKIECEANLSFFRSIQKEIIEISYRFKPVKLIYRCNNSIQYFKFFEEDVEKLLYLEDSPLQHELDLEKYIATFNYNPNLPLEIFEKYRYIYQDILETVLRSTENSIEKEIKWTTDWEGTKESVLDLLWPLKWQIELLKESGNDTAETILDILETEKICNENSKSMEDLKDKTNNFITKCKDLLLTLKNENPRNQKRKMEPLQCVKHIEQFLTILKDFTYLSDEEKKEITKEIPETVKQSISIKEKLIKSIEEGFSLNIDEYSKFQISYLPKKKMKTFFDLYKRKDTKALAILETPDPITELEGIFSKNSVDKKKYETLCKTLQFSDRTRKLLGKLVAGQRKKIPGNNLSNLLNRIQLLKRILIEENEDILDLWSKVKSQTAKQYAADKIVWYYMRDPSLAASVEMLFLDCISLFEKQKGIENPWIKSSKLYSGINLRNVVSHGSPFLESLCKFQDPKDLPSDVIKKMILLIEDEETISIILELYKRLNNDCTKLQEVVNNERKDEYFELKNRILKCDKWKNYVSLLPYNQTLPINET